MSSHPTRIHLLLACTVAGCIVLAVTALTSVAHAQTPPLDDETAGLVYYIVFPDTTANELDPRYPNTRVRSEASVWMYSPVATNVTIRQISTGSSIILPLEAGKFRAYSFTVPVNVTEINTPSRVALIAEAESPIVMYCYWATFQGLETWTAIPVDRWGKEYMAAAIPAEMVKSETAAGEVEISTATKDAQAEILVTAAFDSTHVTLHPPGGVRFAGNPPMTFTLQHGESWLLESYPDTLAGHDRQRDIAGTRITADKAIGVLSGNTRAQAYRRTADTLQGILGNAYKNMMVEALTPIELSGRQSAFLPSWDDHRSGIGAAAQRDTEYARVYNVSGKLLHGSYLAGGDSARRVTFTIAPDTLLEIPFTSPALPPAATVITTDVPAQVMMHSSAIVQFLGRMPCFRGIDCISYAAWAPYMVSMTPREQWSSFAPYYAPPNPRGMSNFVSVVTDTLSAKNIFMENGTPFLFQRRIPGTDLIWGTRAIDSGRTHWIEGRFGVRFAGVVFGVMAGGEDYRPGAARRKDDGASIAGAAHPLEYEEYNAVSYGYPLAARRTLALPGPDSVVIETTSDCLSMTVTAKATNGTADPVGFRSVTLNPQASQNTKLVPVVPDHLSDIISRDSFTVRVVVTDLGSPAHAEVTIKDRSGKVWSVPFTYAPHLPTFDQSRPSSTEVVAGSFVSDTVVVLNDSYPLDITIDAITMRNTARSGITVTAPALPYVLPIRATLPLVVHYGPAVSGRVVHDTLEVIPECGPTLSMLITYTGRPRGAGVERGDGNDEHGGVTIAGTPHGASLHFHLAESGPVLVELFDAAGRCMGTLADATMEAGDHALPLDDRTLAAGAYYCRVSTPRWTATGSWVVVR